MYLPANVKLDYDNVELFQKYAVEGAQLKFLILVSNQYGPNKIAVYGYGEFPDQESERERAALKEAQLEGKSIQEPESVLESP